MNFGRRLTGGLRRARLASACAALIAAVPAQASADETLDVDAAVQIRAAVAEPAPAGTCTDVRFELVNDGRVGLHVLGISSEVSSMSRLVAKVSAVDNVTLESVSVAAEETVDFAKARWFEICGLTASLKTGDRFTAKLHTIGWSTIFPVHVH